MIGGGEPRLGSGTDSAVEERLPFVAGFILLIFAVFVVRLFQLQLLQGEELGDRSVQNAVRTVRLEAPRGDILDREGRVLATTRPAFGINVVPNDLRDRERTFRALAQLLEADSAELDALVGTPGGRARFKAVRLEGDVSLDARARVESHAFAMPGVDVDLQPRRYYVEGELASHLLGYIGEITKQQLERRDYADYKSGETIGQAGVETLLESHLRGRAGGRNQVVDAHGRVADVLDEVEPVPGGSVRLTLDLDLQRAAEEAFLPEVIGGTAKMGAVVALDPRNGDVLALLSKPAFDPNDFAGGIDSRTWKALTTDEWRPIQNRAISGQYPPGSTYKAIVAAAALEEGLITPDERIFCPGHFRLGRRTYRCWKRPGHGSVALREAIQKSCDVYFYQVGLRLGIDRLAFFAKAFQLGQKTGIPLGQERPGLVPTRAWKERRFKEPWVKGETVSAAIGQGFNLVTPLQLAVAYGAVANGGTIVKPRLLKNRRDAGGEWTAGPAPEVLGKLPISQRNLDLVVDGLEAVVGELGGTGGRARIKGLRVAGKTGTSQVVRLRHTEGLEDDEIPIRMRDHAWFVGFAPVGAPEIVVAALAEHGGHGSSAAAPVVGRVLAAWHAKRSSDEPGAPEKTAARDGSTEREVRLAGD